MYYCVVNLLRTLDDEKTASKATELTLCHIAAHILDSKHSALVEALFNPRWQTASRAATSALSQF